MTQQINCFADFGLSENLLKALADKEFTKPSPVQAQAIPHLLQGKHIIAKAQTGTGKTAAFSLPILQHLNCKLSAPQALIVAPTRELAIQSAAELESLAKYMSITITVLCGGQSYKPQIDDLRKGAHIVVGTPGRILDHLDKGSLKLDKLSTFVLDEADEMLRMGFIEDVEKILSKLPQKRQIALFSATMPADIRKIANTYLTDPVSIEIINETATVKSIEQHCIMVSPAQKTDALLRLLEVEKYQSMIVFVRTKKSTEEVATSLQQQNYRAMAIHSELSQPTREQIVSNFRQGRIDILIATDIAARGFDVDTVTHVINYDVPHDSETYVHRIGRTGRAGRSGKAILFLSIREKHKLSIIERHTRQSIETMRVPDDAVIQQARQQRFMTEIEQRLNHANLPDYQGIISDFMSKHADVSVEKIAAALALWLHKDQPWQRKLPTIKISHERKEGRDNRESRSFDKSGRAGKPMRSKSVHPEKNYDSIPQALYRLEVGATHGVKPGNIVGAIANEAGLQSRYITGLKIYDDYSTVKLPKGMPKEIYQDLHKAWVCGRQLKLTAVQKESA